MLLSSVEFGKRDSESIVIFLAGYPDNEQSAWGDVLKHVLSSNKFADYRVICLCLPDLQDNAKHQPWGYSFIEIVDALDATINHHVPNLALKFTLVVHDWGSTVGQMYENRSSRIEKIILFDVGAGLMKGKRSESLAIFIVILYQWWWAYAYILSQVFGDRIGNFVYACYGALVPSSLHPTALDNIPRPSASVNVHMCYLYYRFWKAVFSGTLPSQKFPRCPVLYLVSNRQPSCTI